ncbi:pyridoxamine 5'-phosphate oxidase family protein [Ancylobacter sonchi]|uniref:pyridoxamine 5'-phosphate oxidase family protein n=1 Tax=Ancylobacter sonchi TaxID=1937790 RepID=UPI001BD253FF|nr:pyridoxamine 5'-phosphate oxidase family protein [Ancylobacter sonchi]MBS7532640.1 pyridoxamine 5'-phosphate oxidase family protein [Ancylobacter sonchi]
MATRYLDIATTPSVAAAQEHYGSAEQWARIGARGEPDDAGRRQRLGPPEQAFIAACDGFYLASVSETGWPYVQYRGGPAGFLATIDPSTLGFADFRGNRQYITTGNVQANDRVSLFLMDYAHRRRLKIFGRMTIIDALDDPALTAKLAVPGYPGRVERLALIAVEAFDWNCPQHITPRFTQDEFEVALAPVRDELAVLRRENERLHRELQSVARRRGDDAGSAS